MCIKFGENTNNKNKGAVKIKGKKAKYISCACFVLLCICSFVIGMKAVPKAVSYSVSDNVAMESVSKKVNDIDYTYENECFDVNSVPSLDKYTLVSVDGEICVKSEDVLLYRVKAVLRDFPSEDINALQKGIEINGKAELVEFVEYMES